MAEKNELDKKTFLSMARVFGLDINDPHIEDLYAYVQKVLPTLKRVEELDVGDIEPVFPLILPSSPGRGLRREPRRTGMLSGKE